MDKLRSRTVIIRAAAAAVVVLLIVLGQPWAIVPPGHRGVLVRLGAVQQTVLPEGFHFRVPVLQRVVLMDVRVQKAETKAEAASKDLQTVASTVAVNYHVDPGAVAALYQGVGPEYKDRIIDPAVQEVVKAVTAQYTAEELISRRSEVSARMREMLTQRLRPYHLAVDDFSVTNFSFSEEFNRAIEAKQTAEQLALKAQRDLERVKVEAQQRIEQARAEAEALRLQREALTPELLRLREIEAQMRAIEKWDGKLPQYTGGPVPLIPLEAAGGGQNRP